MKNKNTLKSVDVSFYIPPDKGDFKSLVCDDGNAEYAPKEIAAYKVTPPLHPLNTTAITNSIIQQNLNTQMLALASILI